MAGQLTGGVFLVLLFVCKLFATTVSLGSGSSGGIFSPSLFMGATLGAAFAGLIGAVLPGVPVSLPAFAMVGMGAMVGGGTGAAMTAVTMIFEMTLDYNIVLPMILAVASASACAGCSRAENIYTMKLVRRGHAMPRGLHANLFLVRSARDVMLRDVAILDAATSFAAFLRRSESAGGVRHVVVTRQRPVVGVLRVNIDLRRAVGAAGAEVTLGELARRNFTVVRENCRDIRRDRPDAPEECSDGAGDPAGRLSRGRSHPWRHHQGTDRRQRGQQHRALSDLSRRARGRSR